MPDIQDLPGRPEKPNASFDKGDPPDEVLAYTEERPILDEEGEPAGTEEVDVVPQYYWLLNMEPGSAQFYMRQSTDPWSYQENTEGMSPGQLRTVATLAKVCTLDDECEVPKHPVKYGGEERSTCEIPQYLFVNWQQDGVIFPLALAAKEAEKL
jgi:hypothetical protein